MTKGRYDTDIYIENGEREGWNGAIDSQPVGEQNVLCIGVHPEGKENKQKNKQLMIVQY